jgi:hypothetical protein
LKNSLQNIKKRLDMGMLKGLHKYAFPDSSGR